MQNNDEEIDLLELSKKVWSERKKVIKWGIIGAIVGLIVAFSMPKEYQTVVKVAIEGNEATTTGSDLAEMAGINIGSRKPADGISSSIYPEIISSTPFLLDLAKIKVTNDDNEILFYDYITEEQMAPWWNSIITAPFKALGWISGLFSDKVEVIEELDIFKPTKKQIKYINSLKKLISMDIGEKKSSTTIITTMQDPYIAALISDSVLTNLQCYIVNYKTSKTRADLENNIKKLNEAQAKYYYADSLYAVSLDRNQNLITQEAKIRLERLANEKNLTFSIYQQIARQVESDKIKLQENTPIATIIEPASVSIKASSPNKPVVLILFTFLGGFVAICVIIVKQLLKKGDEEVIL